MPKKAKEMKPVELSRLLPGRHAVGGVAGLLLQIPNPDKPLKDGRARTAKTWVLRTSVGGRRRDIGLGGYPEVGLADARDRARAVKRRVFDGADPVADKRAARAQLAAAAGRAVTFRKAAEGYIATMSHEWRNSKSEAQWSSSLETYAYPTLGHLDVADITTSHVVDCLTPIWTTKTETASRVRGRIESIIASADKRADRERLNPARWRGHLDKLLPKPSKVAKVEHHAALPYGEMYAFMQRLREVEGEGARALQYAILTAARSGEVRGATWSEIDLKAGVWTIPKGRMKGGRDHRVPLSAQAIELLREPGKHDELVFKGAKADKPLSDMTLTAVLRRMEVAATAHGFRSTFRDWAGDATAFQREVVEAALAHAIGDDTEAAYRRGDALDKRKQLMTAWADYIDTAPVTATVTPIRRNTKKA